MSRFVPAAKISPREHHAWAARMWKRMDRDGSGSIVVSELDCEEFRSVVKSVLAPSTGHCMGGAAYARAKLNMDQAISLCFRKADVNNDGSLSFHEFKSFMLTLRNAEIAHHTGHIIFSLFDVDTNNFIDAEEFRELWRFFMARSPTHEEFQKEWLLLDARAEGQVSREHFISWLQSSANPLFRRHGMAAPNHGRADDDFRWSEAPSETLGELQRDSDGWRPWHAYRHFCWSEPTKGKPNFGNMKFRCNDDPSAWKERPRSGSRAVSVLASLSSVAGSSGSSRASQRAQWNRSFGGGNPNWVNGKGVPTQMKVKRSLFARPQSLPELRQFYDTHPGHEANSRRLQRPEPRTTAFEDASRLSSEKRHEIELLPNRRKKAGCMPLPATGEKVKWKDSFIEAPQLGSFLHPPAASSIGEPPRHLYADLYDDWEPEVANSREGPKKPGNAFRQTG